MDSKTERFQNDENLSSKNNNEKNDKNDKDELKDSYSSFIIKMLENKKYNNNSRNKKTIYIGDSFKKVSKKNYFKTNYTKRINNNFILKNSKSLNKNNNSFKNSKSYTFKVNNNNISKKGNNYSYTTNKRNNIQLNNINNKNFNIYKINSYNSKNNIYNNKGKEEKNKSKEKDKKNKSKIKNVLNKLYGYNKKYKFSKNTIFKNKNLIELDNYQNNILQISQNKLSRDNLIRLYSELQTIKTEANMIKPLPPVNFPALVIHSFKEVEDKENHRTTLSYEKKKLKDMDEYEKELYQIKKSNGFKRTKIIRNKRLYKILEILPEHVVDVVFKNKNKII